MRASTNSNKVMQNQKNNSNDQKNNEKAKIYKTYLEFKKDDYKRKHIKEKRKTCAKILIGQLYQFISILISSGHLLMMFIFITIGFALLCNNFKSYYGFYIFDFSYQVLLFAEYILNYYCFRKNFMYVNGNIRMGVILTLNLIIDITNINLFQNALKEDDKDYKEGEYFSNDIHLLVNYSIFGQLMLGVHKVALFYYASIKIPELKTRILRLREKRKTQQEKRDKESQGLYFIYERVEQKPLEKAFSKLQEFQRLIPRQERDISFEMETIIKIIKECLENEKRLELQNERLLKGMKRLGDREDVNIGGGGSMLKAKISNLHEVMSQMNLNSNQRLNLQDENHLKPSMSEIDDEQQYYSDIQKRIISTAGNVSRSMNSNRNSINLNKEFTVDPIKLSKYLKDYNKGIENCLAKIDTFEFNIFNLRSLSSGKELVILGYEIAQQNNLIEQNSISKFVYLSFLQGIAQSYNSVAYHNKTHAGDVLQGLHYFLKTGRIAELIKLGPLEHIGAIVAAISHDVDHPGFNNSFLVGTKDEIAILYNDQSVLENHHVAQTFLLLRSEELNIFKRFSPANQNRVREIMIKMVLATDMFYHAQNMQQMQRIIEKTSYDPNIEISNNQRLISEEELISNKVFLLGQTLHLADISNPCREWQVCSKWTDLVFREFFYQGDLERSMGLPISNLCDRKTINIPQTQVGFINYLVVPVFTEFQKICFNIEPLLLRAQQNRQKWEELKEVFENHKEVQQEPLTIQDLGGFQGEYFSYENYRQRKIKAAQQAPSNIQSNPTHQSQSSKSPLTPHHHMSISNQNLNQNSPSIKSQIIASSKNHNSNQRISFLTRKSSIKSGNKNFITYNHDTEIGVLALKEESSSQNSSSGSLTGRRPEAQMINSVRDTKLHNQDRISEKQQKQEESNQTASLNQLISKQLTVRANVSALNVLPSQNMNQDDNNSRDDQNSKVSFLTKSNNDEESAIERIMDQENYDNIINNLLTSNINTPSPNNQQSPSQKLSKKQLQKMKALADNNQINSNRFYMLETPSNSAQRPNEDETSKDQQDYSLTNAYLEFSQQHNNKQKRSFFSNINNNMNDENIDDERAMMSRLSKKVIDISMERSQQDDTINRGGEYTIQNGPNYDKTNTQVFEEIIANQVPSSASQNGLENMQSPHNQNRAPIQININKSSTHAKESDQSPPLEQRTFIQQKSFQPSLTSSNTLDLKSIDKTGTTMVTTQQNMRKLDLNMEIVSKQRHTAQKILVNHLLMDRSGNIKKHQ